MIKKQGRKPIDKVLHKITNDMAKFIDSSSRTEYFSFKKSPLEKL